MIRPPGLAVVLVGDDEGSRIYVRRKGQVAERLGYRQIDLPADTPLDAIVSTGEQLNADDAIDGIPRW